MALDGLILLISVGIAGQAEPSASSPPRGARARGSAPVTASRIEAVRVVATMAEPPARAGWGSSREGLQAALERGLAAGGLDVIPHREADVSLSRHPELRPCGDSACRARLGRLLGASLCAEGRVIPTGQQLEVVVSVLECATGAPLAIVRRACKSGTDEQAASAVANLAEQTGRTALEAWLSRSRDGAGGLTAHPERHSRASMPFVVSGLALAGVGLVALVTGATLWGLDGRVYERTATQDRLYRTGTGGITSTSLGIAAVVGGITMALVAWKRGPSTRVSSAREGPVLSVTVDPVRRLVGLSGSF